jgi:5,10-methenyltetrahydrofolate synthetase
MNKVEIRSHLKKLRLDLPDAKRLALSQQICRRLETLDWSTARNVHYFEPIARLGEVDINTFIADLNRQYPDIQLHTSRHTEGTWTVVSRQGHSVSKSLQFDAVIVPMLGFDTNLQRIGYGGGYYDTFLATQPQARKIGICFEIGKVESIPAELHDIPLDCIITESQVYRN